MSYKKIVVGIDGSETSLAALRSAARLASSSAGELIVVCAYTPPDEMALARMKNQAPSDVAWKATQTAAAERALGQGREVAQAEGVEVDARTAEGDPTDAIIDLAESEGADLIVVGSVGMTGAKRFLLGSVPNKISHHAPCDVLIVKTS